MCRGFGLSLVGAPTSVDVRAGGAWGSRGRPGCGRRPRGAGRGGGSPAKPALCPFGARAGRSGRGGLEGRLAFPTAMGEYGPVFCRPFAGAAPLCLSTGKELLMVNARSWPRFRVACVVMLAALGGAAGPSWAGSNYSDKHFSVRLPPAFIRFTEVSALGGETVANRFSSAINPA